MEAVLENLLASAIWAALTRGAGWIIGSRARSISRASTMGGALEATSRALQAYAQVEFRDTPALSSYLASADFRVFMTHMLTSSVLRQSGTGLVDLARELEAQANLHGVEFSSPTSPSTLVRRISEAFDSALAAGVGDQEGRSLDVLVLRYQARLEAEMRAARASPAIFEMVARRDAGERRTFETLLRRALAARHATITPEHPAGRVRRPIDRLYVAPSLARFDHFNREGFVTLSEFMDEVGHGVVLGAPGAGKSTLSTRLISKFAIEDSRYWATGAPILPFLVVVREFVTETTRNPQSILEYVENTIRVRYQMDAPAPGMIEYMLATSRMMVIFDGLDEVQDTYQRETVRSNIESFVLRFPDAPIVVTSRFVGYEEAPLSSEMFRCYWLSDFSTAQVLEYATNWFADVTDDADLAQGRVRAFMRQSETAARDLRVNPLLLSLLCSLFDDDGYIPDNRPEVYERCTKLLFEGWDYSRGISARDPAPPRSSGLLQRLANEIADRTVPDRSIPRQMLLERATRYFLDVRQVDDDAARQDAEAFVAYCVGRSWVFTEIGIQARDQAYEFTHATFLEYFAALYLSNLPEEEMLTTIRRRITRRAWEDASLLSLQVASRLPGRAERLFEGLLSDFDGDDKQTTEFACRSLAFVAPHLSTLGSVVKAGVQLALDTSNPGAMTSLLNASSDNYPHVAKIARDYLAEIIEADDPPNKAALGLALSFGTVVQSVDHPDRREALAESARDIMSRVPGAVPGLMSSADTAQVAYLFGLATLDDIWERYGGEAFFGTVGTFPFIGRLLSPVEHVIRGFKQDQTSFSPDCEEVGRLFRKHGFGWVQRDRRYDFFPAALQPIDDAIGRENGDPSSAALYGLFVILSTAMEILDRPVMESHDSPRLNDVIRITLGQLSPADTGWPFDWSVGELETVREWQARRGSMVARQVEPKAGSWSPSGHGLEALIHDSKSSDSWRPREPGDIGSGYH
ncbi:MAG TPA: NACHT domain-containing protein [Candidatus Limnocylindrales bacterium]|nr:NACHT domain-containing protein [Candidatus Limnocylindrales bacterium]